MTPMMRNRMYSKKVRVVDGVSIDSNVSYSVIPSNDQARCFAIFHQLKLRKEIKQKFTLLNST